jgi:hypothetical protein
MVGKTLVPSRMVAVQLFLQSDLTSREHDRAVLDHSVGYTLRPGGLQRGNPAPASEHVERDGCSYFA